MSAPRNDRCSCRKSGAYATRDVALRELERVQELAQTSGQLYVPTGVERCPAGVWHLTSKTAKRWKSGKPRRRAR